MDYRTQWRQIRTHRSGWPALLGFVVIGFFLFFAMFVAFCLMLIQIVAGTIAGVIRTILPSRRGGLDYSLMQPGAEKASPEEPVTRSGPADQRTISLEKDPGGSWRSRS